MYFFNLLNVLYNTFYSLTFYKNKTVLNILEYDNNKTINPTIYYTRLPEHYDKKILVYLSGVMEFRYTEYIDKTLQHMEKYNIPSFIYENTNTLMFLCVDDISNFIIFLSNKYIDKEIIILGFSSGGIIASHVIEKLQNIKNIKRFITYDTPYSLDKVIKSFVNSYFRFDIIMAYYLNRIYLKLFKNIIHKFNYSYIDGYNFIYDSSICILSKHILSNNILSKHILSKNKYYYKIMNMNFNLPYYIKMYNINSIKDPIADYEKNMKIMNKNSDIIDFEIYTVDNKNISHCTDMFYSDNSNLIMKCLRD
jgi:hypothetical protein